MKRAIIFKKDSVDPAHSRLARPFNLKSHVSNLSISAMPQKTASWNNKAHPSIRRCAAFAFVPPGHRSHHHFHAVLHQRSLQYHLFGLLPLSTRLLELVGRRRGFVKKGRRGCGSIYEVDQSSRADNHGRWFRDRVSR